jgi:hypothetical protein
VTDEPERAGAPPSTAGAASVRRLIIPAAIAIIAVVVAVVAANLIGGPGRKVETGVVVAVEATSLTSVQGFSIKTGDGRTVDFQVGKLENGAVFPPGHLAEHRVSLVPIRVTYIDEGGRPVAIRIEDAP